MMDPPSQDALTEHDLTEQRLAHFVGCTDKSAFCVENHLVAGRRLKN